MMCLPKAPYLLYDNIILTKKSLCRLNDMGSCCLRIFSSQNVHELLQLLRPTIQGSDLICVLQVFALSGSQLANAFW